ncbi:MAG: aspartyl protease family protein [Saprospiraceae bacterium]
MLIKLRFSFLFLIYFAFSLQGQYNGFRFVSGKSIEIPFELHQNLIVVDLVLGNKLPVKFIFDTGAEHTIVCKKELISLLGLPYERSFKIMGADFKTVLEAHLVKRVPLNLVNNLAFAVQDLLVLDEDYYRLDESIGQPVHGIIGADLFNRYLLKIDYIAKKITLSETEVFKIPNNFSYFPIEVIKGKPYFYPRLALQPGTYFDIKLLLDTGAGVSLLLLNHSHPLLSIPQNSLKGTLAMGLGGNIEGCIGRISELKLSSEISFPQLITDFQDISDNVDSTFALTKNGIFGEKLLQRFDVIVDYQRSGLYLKPNKYSKKALREDKSGIRVIAQGRYFDEYYVNDVIPGSPADAVDIRMGDRILSINRYSMVFCTLETLSNKMSGKVGKRIILKIERNGKVSRKHFILQNLIQNN